jgi:hypothetical protein
MALYIIKNRMNLYDAKDDNTFYTIDGIFFMLEPLKGFFTAIFVVAVTFFCVNMGRGSNFMYFYALPLVSLLIPILMPNLKWLIGVIALYALALAALIVLVASEEDMDAGGAIALSMLAWVFVAFTAGSFIRFCIHILYGIVSKKNKFES